MILKIVIWLKFYLFFACNLKSNFLFIDLEVMSGIPAEIPKLREVASRERRHLCLQLLAPSGTSVTALSFISRTNQLAVGFSDGYLSLWNMKTLRRE